VGLHSFPSFTKRAKISTETEARKQAFLEYSEVQKKLDLNLKTRT
jgi:hypothetical protein